MYRALALVSENLERIYTHKKTAGDRAAREDGKGLKALLHW